MKVYYSSIVDMFRYCYEIGSGVEIRRTTTTSFVNNLHSHIVSMGIFNYSETVWTSKEIDTKLHYTCNVFGLRCGQ